MHETSPPDPLSEKREGEKNKFGEVDTKRTRCIASLQEYRGQLMQTDSMWEQLASRDHAADGEFVYAVATTGVYCRPSCKSRLPKRENVVFFTLPAQAEGAGFRACKRCHPREAQITDPRLSLVQNVCDHMRAHVDQKLTLKALGDHFGYEASYLGDVFKAALGVTPHQYAQLGRLDHLKTSLKNGTNITEAIYEAGFASASRVYDSGVIGMTPGAYRDGGRSETISYTIATCCLGALLVGMTERGVCAVGIYDDERAAELALVGEFPAAQLHREDAQLQETINAILDHVEGTRPALDLPLDIQATAFQWRVWDELRRIPRGETRTYSQVAAAMGSPNAVRAVASACANNHAAIVIPCHRVIGKDGKLTGYRWGVDRKRLLLEHESG